MLSGCKLIYNSHMDKIDADLIIFDLDGTLIDSKKDIACAVNLTLQRMDVRPLPDETIYGYVGNGVRPLIEETLKKRGRAVEIQVAIKHFQELYITHLLDTTVMFNGIPEILQNFRSRKKMAVASNKPYRYIKKILDGLNMTRFFASVKGGDSVEMKKPAPDMLNVIMDETSTSKENSVFIGDSGIDIRTGKNAGVRTIGATYGFRSVGEIMENNPDALINSPYELEKIIE